MSRAALRSVKINTASVPSPVGGLNAVNAYAQMPPTDAIQMDNWVPGVNSCSIRNGYASWLTGVPDPVETLLTYQATSSVQMFAAAGTKIYDATSAGAVGAAVVSGLTNSQWQFVNFGNVGGQYVLAVNGADKMRVYNGTTWGYDGDGTYPAVTGVSTANCKDIQVYANRVWLIEKNSFRVWYLPLASIGGAASSIDLSGFYILGGSLHGMVTWQVSSTYSVVTYAAFVSSMGEVLLYQGSDPSNAATWSKVGQFRMGRPIGQRFYERMGEDTVLLTADGVMPMSKAAATDRREQSDAISFKITQIVNNEMQAYSGNFGWQMCFYPFGNKLFVNVPRDGPSAPTDNVQYVMNTITNTWCRYTGLKANCWALYKDSVFFGSSDGVYVAESGHSDNGAAISAACTPAYSYFKAPGQQKMFTMARPIITANGAFSPSIGLALDFSGTANTSTPTLCVGITGSAWDAVLWDVSPWGDATRTSTRWQYIGGTGFAATITMASSTKDMNVTWAATDFSYERGGIL